MKTGVQTAQIVILNLPGGFFLKTYSSFKKCTLIGRSQIIYWNENNHNNEKLRCPHNVKKGCFYCGQNHLLGNSISSGRPKIYLSLRLWVTEKPMPPPSWALEKLGA